jgi:hypothetical protein
MTRRVAISLSLATLWMLKVWRELLDDSWDFFRIAPPARLHYLLAIFITLLLAAIFLLVQNILTKTSRGKVLGRAAFLCACLIAVASIENSLGRIRLVVEHTLNFIPFTVVAIFVPITIGLCCIFLRRLTQAAVLCLLIVFPFTVLILGKAAWRTISPRRIEQPFVTKDAAPGASMPRVVWIIFDEMDQHVAFADRPPGLRLPELDAFQAIALYGTHATAPGTQTHYSMPELITGLPIKDVQISGASELLITFANGDRVSRFSEADNVFRQARARGFRTGIVGNYLPYCRILGSDLDFCSNLLAGAEAGSATTLEDAFAEQVQSFLNSLPYHDRLPALAISIKKHTANYIGVLKDARKAAADPRLNLLLIHFPIPHLPGVSGSPAESDRARAYIDNLILVDRSLREIHQEMSRAGLWDKSNILISADHGFRDRPDFDNRVPFLLKLSGQKERFDYNAPFHTILTHDLILTLLLEPGLTPQSVSAWLHKEPFEKTQGSQNTESSRQMRHVTRTAGYRFLKPRSKVTSSASTACTNAAT